MYTKVIDRLLKLETYRTIVHDWRKWKLYRTVNKLRPSEARTMRKHFGRGNVMFIKSDSATVAVAIVVT